ncbi:hypothetical protein BegalDRAFT_1735 [Beggiatoa alba B18LD]|uniref:Uncharacterized protein n=1 Tax=Beggiatoa alba B18LD TaxID=395493 RepID=I3CG69_9GAMM|nr:MTH938/NDUFAF3 family protein [Beggiatoa alba]EIJ42612.1 hypothetical protein BegalDRAFT_1735 [Beggiatoa alba B18LD]
MKLHLATSDNINYIQAYDKTSITIREKQYLNNVLIMPTRLEAWTATGFSTLTADDFMILTTWKPALVLLGTADKLRFPPSEVLSPLIKLGIGVEVMDRYAACRTFNILVAEGRDVAAALLLTE